MGRKALLKVVEHTSYYVCSFVPNAAEVQFGSIELQRHHSIVIILLRDCKILDMKKLTLSQSSLIANVQSQFGEKFILIYSILGS